MLTTRGTRAEPRKSAPLAALGTEGANALPLRSPPPRPLSRAPACPGRRGGARGGSTSGAGPRRSRGRDSAHGSRPLCPGTRFAPRPRNALCARRLRGKLFSVPPSGDHDRRPNASHYVEPGAVDGPFRHPHARPCVGVHPGPAGWSRGGGTRRWTGSVRPGTAEPSEHDPCPRPQPALRIPGGAVEDVRRGVHGGPSPCGRLRGRGLRATDLRRGRRTPGQCLLSNRRCASSRLRANARTAGLRARRSRVSVSACVT